MPDPIIRTHEAVSKTWHQSQDELSELAPDPYPGAENDAKIPAREALRRGAAGQEIPEPSPPDMTEEEAARRRQSRSDFVVPDLLVEPVPGTNLMSDGTVNPAGYVPDPGDGVATPIRASYPSEPTAADLARREQVRQMGLLSNIDKAEENDT